MTVTSIHCQSSPKGVGLKPGDWFEYEIVRSNDLSFFGNSCEIIKNKKISDYFKILCWNVYFKVISKDKDGSLKLQVELRDLTDKYLFDNTWVYFDSRYPDASNVEQPTSPFFKLQLSILPNGNFKQIDTVFFCKISNITYLSCSPCKFSHNMGLGIRPFKAHFTEILQPLFFIIEGKLKEHQNSNSTETITAKININKNISTTSVLLNQGIPLYLKDNNNSYLLKKASFRFPNNVFVNGKCLDNIGDISIILPESKELMSDKDVLYHSGIQKNKFQGSFFLLKPTSVYIKIRDNYYKTFISPGDTIDFTEVRTEKGHNSLLFTAPTH